MVFDERNKMLAIDKYWSGLFVAYVDDYHDISLHQNLAS